MGKYTVTDRLGSAITDAVDNVKSSSKSETTEAVTGFFDGVVDAVKAADNDIDFKGTIGTLAMSASDIANQAVDQVVEVDGKYNLVGQIREKIGEATAAASEKVAGASA